MVDTQHFGDRRPDEERQLDELLAELRAGVAALTQGIADDNGNRWSLTATQVLSQGRGARRDGWASTATRAPSPRGPRPSSSDPEADGGHTAYGDTVGGIATALTGPEVVAARSLMAALLVSRDALRSALEVIEHATPATAHPRRLEVGCRVCGDPDIYRGSRENASERCRWCYDHWCEYGEDMPRRIIAWRKQGKAITPAMIRSELGMELVG